MSSNRMFLFPLKDGGMESVCVKRVEKYEISSLLCIDRFLSKGSIETGMF